MSSVFVAVEMFEASLTNSVDPDQAAPFEHRTFAPYTQNTPTKSGNHMQQTTFADDIFGCIFKDLIFLRWLKI